MTEPGKLPPALEELISAEKAAPAGSTSVRDEILDRLVVTHGEAALSAVAAAKVSGAGAAAAATSLATKLTVIAVIAAGAFTIGFWTGAERGEVVVVHTTEPDHAGPPKGVATIPVLIPVVQPPASRETANPEIASSEITSADHEADRDNASPAPQPPTPPTISPPPPAPTSPVNSTASAQLESELLRTAWAAYDAGDHAAATLALDVHATEFSEGLLSEEREALWIRVRVDAGDIDTARQQAESFAEEFPDSIHGPAVRRAISKITGQNIEPPDKE